ncbi:MAG: alpha/beta fold hydrolase, partial [Rhodospirillales bacterium]|nr:alpha/beta fold hydrolase [Rhodospirillales bacterium]
MRIFWLGLFWIVALAQVSGCAYGSVEDLAVQPDRDVVVVLHGLGRGPYAMRLLAARLEEAGYQVANVGYDSLSDTPDQILEDIGRQINRCCVNKTPKLHFVGHSLGGLLIRAYLMENYVPNLGRVVLIGTPNGGSAAIDGIRDRWWFGILGPTANAMGTDENGFAKRLVKPDYPLGVIAGIVEDDDNEDRLPGPDDGLVAVDSTKVEGMADFVLMPTSHWGLRYD